MCMWVCVSCMRWITKHHHHPHCLLLPWWDKRRKHVHFSATVSRSVKSIPITAQLFTLSFICRQCHAVWTVHYVTQHFSSMSFRLVNSNTHHLTLIITCIVHATCNRLLLMTVARVIHSCDMFQATAMRFYYKRTADNREMCNKDNHYGSYIKRKTNTWWSMIIPVTTITLTIIIMLMMMMMLFPFVSVDFCCHAAFQLCGAECISTVTNRPTPGFLANTTTPPQAVWAYSSGCSLRGPLTCATSIHRSPPCWLASPKRPIPSVLLRTIDSDLKPLNLGLHSALWRASDRPSWRCTVETAMLFDDDDDGAEWWFLINSQLEWGIIRSL